MSAWQPKKIRESKTAVAEVQIAPEPIEESIEVVKEVVQVEAPKPNPVESAEPVVLVSEMDAYIHERMKGQPKTIAEIDAKVIKNYDDPTSILEIPKELKKLEDKYSFCWISKKKRSIDEYIDVLEFSFVNRAIFPSLPKHLFTANGSIERGDLILAFLPIKQAEILRNRPGELSREKVKSTLVQDLDRWKDTGDEKFYKPDSGVSEGEEKEPRGRFVQPDAIESAE
jgi:hypothetical protein